MNSSSNYSANSLLKLLFKTLSVVENKGKNKLIKLLILLIIQSLLDVVTIASIIPLFYVLEGKDNLIKNFSFLLRQLNMININIDINLLILYVPISVIIVMIVSTFSRLFIVYKTNTFIEEIRYSISSKLMSKYVKNKFNLKEKSEIAKSILSEVDQFIIIVFQPTILMITNIFLLLGILIYIFYTNIISSLFSVSLLIGFYIVFYIFSKKILNIEGFKSERANKGRFKVAIESLENIKDIKIYRAEDFFKSRFKNFSRSFALANSTYNTLVASPKFILEMIVFSGLSMAILFISFKDNIEINSIPLLGTFAFAAYKAQPALSNIIYGVNSLEYGSKIISNLYSELNSIDYTNFEIFNKRNIQNFKDNKYCLNLKNISYKFNKSEGLYNVNALIKNKSLFIILGESGSGKSTLLNLISGLIKPQKGNIIFNGFLYKDLKPKISYLHQEYKLFDASIAENIAFGIQKENINIDQLNLSMKQAGIYKYVYKLKNNIYETVGENGSTLSVGQKQRIALARALYFSPDILLLDEPTSALDKSNENKIIETIVKLSKKITIIMATHRIDSIPIETTVGQICRDNKFEIKNIKDLKIKHNV